MVHNTLAIGVHDVAGSYGRTNVHSTSYIVMFVRTLYEDVRMYFIFLSNLFGHTSNDLIIDKKTHRPRRITIIFVKPGKIFITYHFYEDEVYNIA